MARSKRRQPVRSGSSQPKRRRRVSEASASYLDKLPYEVLRSIFSFASRRKRSNKNDPLVKQGIDSWPESSYLVSLATVCKAFHDPAINVLYHNPSLALPQRAHRLWRKLVDQPELGWKVKRLVLPVEPLLRFMTPGYGGFDVAKFIQLCRGVREIWIAAESEMPPYVDHVQINWCYPMDLFDALESVEGMDQRVTRISLDSWRWNGEWMGNLDWHKMVALHEQPSFKHLKHLSIIYLHSCEFFRPPGTHLVDPTLPDPTPFLQILALLPELRTLEFENCDIVGEHMLTAFPELCPKLRLQSLTFRACDKLKPSDLGVLLTSPICTQLQHLSIYHCRCCNLSFLSSLTFTPLISLTFDGKCFRTQSGYNDAHPDFTTLFPLDTVPVWPVSLQELTLLHLRQWTSEEVHVFLSSLLDAAPALTLLRHLELYLIPNESDWRERAQLRDEFIDRLLHAFVRPPSCPPMSPGVSSRTRVMAERGRRKEEKELYRGYCWMENVDVKVDNMRPTEMHYDEDDFLDVRINSIS